jgi:hypothetical protein
MTAPTALDALADRCEAATGADRELDALAFGLCVALPRTGFICADERPGAPGGIADHVPRYSASLDAAMTLVPEGCSANVMMAVGRECWAQVHHFLLGSLIPHKQSSARAAIPALNEQGEG